MSQQLLASFVPPLRIIKVLLHDGQTEGFECHAYYPHDDGSLAIIRMEPAPVAMIQQGFTHFNRCMELFAPGTWVRVRDVSDDFKGGGAVQ